MNGWGTGVKEITYLYRMPIFFFCMVIPLTILVSGSDSR
jgi:hypothetical protein